MNIMPLALPHFGLYLLIIGLFWKLFDWAEKVVKPSIKIQISRSLQSSNQATTMKSWPKQFMVMFDSIFGEKHLSWKCFKSSCGASLVSVLIVTLFWGTLRPLQFKAFWGSGTLLENIFSIYLVGVVINLMPDYLSLIETRWLIKTMSESPRTPRIIAFLGIDIIFNALISLTFIAFSLVVFYIVKIIFPPLSNFPYYGPSPIKSLMLRVVEHGFTLPDYWQWLTHFLQNSLPLTTDNVGEPSPGIWFYSTFFTSVWAWFYALSHFFVKHREGFGIGFKKFMDFLDVENKPFLSIGIVVNILVTLIYLVYLIALCGRNLLS